MKLIIIDRKAWERHHSEFANFIHRVEKLIGNPPETEQWLDNEAVYKRLGISKRTLQSYRDTGKIPFSMIGHKCYYKESDITELLNANNEWIMSENEIITQEDPQMQLFSQLMEGILKNWSGIALPPVRCWMVKFTFRVRKFAANYGSAHARSKSTET